MSLVGDTIFRVRADIPDLLALSTLPAPLAAASVVAGTATIPTGVYALVVTQRNNWGETLPSIEVTGLNVTLGQAIQVTSNLLPGATVMRVYLTQAGGPSGTEIAFVESPTSPFTITAFPVSAGIPPIRSTAYLMDSDGLTFGASTLYTWLNEALVVMSRAVGGIQDYSGVPTLVGQPLYVLPQQWLEISDIWYGGYWLKGSQRNQFFRRTAVQSDLLWGATVSVSGQQQIIEVFPQPDRTSGVTNTTANMITAADTQVTIANPGAFLLPFGFAQIGTEIVAYSSVTSGLMQGLIRGLGATGAQIWPTNTTVTELSLFWAGKRIFQPGNYQPGQALSTLAVPNGWEAILPLYMESLAAKAQNDYQEHKQLSDSFFSECDKLALANKGVVKNVQVGGLFGLRTPTFANTIAGGLVVP